jgi:energy-converting hydrogenase Eha subunit C
MTNDKRIRIALCSIGMVLVLLAWRAVYGSCSGITPMAVSGVVPLACGTIYLLVETWRLLESFRTVRRRDSR